MNVYILFQTYFSEFCLKYICCSFKLETAVYSTTHFQAVTKIEKLKKKAALSVFTPRLSQYHVQTKKFFFSLSTFRVTFNKIVDKVTKEFIIISFCKHVCNIHA